MTTPRLWQRNVFAGVIIAAVLAVLTAVDLAPAWTRYRATQEPAHVAAPRTSVTVNGQIWSVDTVRHVAGSLSPRAPRLPNGTVVDVVTVSRSGPPPPDQFCGAFLVDGERRWRGESYGTYAAPLADGAGIDCRKPGPLQWSFLLPADAVPTALDITAPDGVILLRLEL